MMPVRRFVFVAVALSVAPVHADERPITRTDQLVVVTPSPPIVISNVGAPGAAPPPTVGAPQNEDWTNVSHINGSIVKVGERGDYLLRFRKTNLSSNPIGWILGFYGLSLSHALGNNVALRVDANVIHFEGSSGYEVGGSLPIYFRRTYSGPFLEPGVIARSESSRYCDYNCTKRMVGPEMLFGWHWMFDSGLNVAAALGAARNMNRRSDDSGYAYDAEIEAVGYFRIGYAF